MKGIDVSYANGSINWQKVKHEVDFAILRSSFGSEMPSQIDNCYEQNASGCAANGVPFGIYHFAYFVDEATAKAEADFAIHMAERYRPHVHMIALDIEEDSERYAQSCGKSPDWTACAEVFLERVKAAGYQPVLYTNYSWMTYRFDYSRLEKYPLWLASPGASEEVPKRYANIVLWQNSWTGHFDGIVGDVDTDVCYRADLFKEPSASAGTASQTTQQPQEGLHQIESSAKVHYDVKVTAWDGVNIRSGADTSYPVLGAVPCGETLLITRQTSGGGYVWGLTEYGQVRGWIALNFTKKVARKSLDTLAKEVIRGDWGSGDERERLLEQAGYDYQAVQDRVNQLMGSGA